MQITEIYIQAYKQPAFTTVMNGPFQAFLTSSAHIALFTLLALFTLQQKKTLNIGFFLIRI